MRLLHLFLVVVLLVGVSADMYLHNPPGSNDRNRERNQQRTNANRLFNSQNNAQGGYPWRGNPTVRAAPDAITYYTGSQLNLEWSNQHSCGANPNTQCTLIVQYGCDDPSNLGFPFPMKGIRDGYPDSDTLTAADNNNAGYQEREFTSTSGQNQDGTNTISANQFQGSATTRTQRYNYYYTAVTGNPGVEYGMHEGIDWYDLCRQTQRNQGLYLSDQNLQGNDARFTRQNNDGTQHGLECPEEKEYYPYWRPYVFDKNTVDNQGLPLAGVAAAWYDVAVLTNDTANCDYFQEHSQNCRGYGHCMCNAACLTAANTIQGNNNNLIPWDQETCELAGGAWVQPLGDAVNANTTTGWGPGLFGGTLNPGDLGPNGCKPDCVVHPLSKDNHLGNYVNVDPTTGLMMPSPTGQPEAARYMWTVPNRLSGMLCSLRFRYNISTTDYSDHPFLPTANDFAGTNAVTTEPNQVGWNSDYNCLGNYQPTNLFGKTPTSSDPLSKYHCFTIFNQATAKGFYDRPYLDTFQTGTQTLALGIAMNSDQLGRTFQDRSYVFNVATRPSTVSASANIMNLNMRGRRGNIVQCYPAVEYDFIPNHLTLNQGDYVHVQFHGSDFNNALNANDGEGWQYSDRTNMVQVSRPGDNLPVFPQQITLFPDATTAFRFAYLDQTQSMCQAFTNGNNNDQNNFFNCGKLNMASERWPASPSDGLLTPNAGTYYYVGTRNNNFSNRSMKGIMVVNPSGSSSNTAVIVGATIGSVGAVGLVAAGVLFYGKRHPNSRAGDAYKKCSGCMPNKCKGGSAAYGGASTASGDTEYIRH